MRSAIVLVALVFWPAAMHADQIQMQNGDHYAGKVISMTADNIVQEIIQIPPTSPQGAIYYLDYQSFGGTYCDDLDYTLTLDWEAEGPENKTGYHSTITTAAPSISSSVGQSIPISRTRPRLRRMYSWLAFSKAAISNCSCT